MPTEAQIAEARRAEAQLTEARLTQALGNIHGDARVRPAAKKGLHNVFMRSIRPLVRSQPRCCGRAFTLRFVPAREDLATPASWAPPDLHARRHRGDAGGLGRRCRCDVASPTPASSATSSARRMYKRGVAGARSPTASCATLRGVLATRLAGVVPGQRGAALAMPASPSSPGSSRSAAAALPSCRTTCVVADGDGAVAHPGGARRGGGAAAGEQERLEA